MRELLKKEWRQMHLIPFVYGAFISLILIFYSVSAYCHRLYYGGDPIRFESTTGILAIGCGLAGWLAGSSAIASEVGQNTLQFLTTLPVGRFRIWLAKFSIGLLVTVVSLASVIVAFFLTADVLFGLHPIYPYLTLQSQEPNQIRILMHLVVMIACGYALSLLVSTLVERVAVAAVISLVVGLALFIIVTVISQSHVDTFMTSIRCFDGVALVIGLACVSASAVAFCQGETLRTSRRFVTTGAILFGWSIIATPALVFYISCVRQGTDDAAEISVPRPAESQPVYWIGPEACFVVSPSVREYQQTMQIHPSNTTASMEAVPPAATHDPSPNIHSYVYPEIRPGKRWPGFHFTYRLSGLEPKVRPGQRIALQREEIDLLDKTGNVVGAIWLTPIVIGHS